MQASDLIITPVQEVYGGVLNFFKHFEISSNLEEIIRLKPETKRVANVAEHFFKRSQNLEPLVYEALNHWFQVFVKECDGICFDKTRLKFIGSFAAEILQKEKMHIFQELLEKEGYDTSRNLEAVARLTERLVHANSLYMSLNLNSYSTPSLMFGYLAGTCTSPYCNRSGKYMDQVYSTHKEVLLKKHFEVRFRRLSQDQTPEANLKAYQSFLNLKTSFEEDNAFQGLGAALQIQLLLEFKEISKISHFIVVLRNDIFLNLLMHISLEQARYLNKKLLSLDKVEKDLSKKIHELLVFFTEHFNESTTCKTDKLAKDIRDKRASLNPKFYLNPITTHANDVYLEKEAIIHFKELFTGLPLSSIDALLLRDLNQVYSALYLRCIPEGHENPGSLYGIYYKHLIEARNQPEYKDAVDDDEPPGEVFFMRWSIINTDPLVDIGLIQPGEDWLAVEKALISLGLVDAGCFDRLEIYNLEALRKYIHQFIPITPPTPPPSPEPPE